MSKDKKPDMFDLFNDDSLWGNKESSNVSHDEIMNENWNYKKTKAQRDRQSKITKAHAQDPNWIKKVSSGVKKYHMENPEAAKVRANNPETVLKQKENMKKFMESGLWKMPSFAGHTHTDEVKKEMSERMSGKERPLETNKKISKYLKGKKKSTTVKQKVSKGLKGTTHRRGRRVMTPKGEFAKIKLAAEAYGVTDMAIKNKIVNPRHQDFYFLDDINSLGAQKVHTDKGIFNNSDEAAKACNISVNGLRHRIHSDNWSDFYYLDEQSNFTSPQLTDDS